MTLVDFIFLSLALAMDCFAVSLAVGMGKPTRSVVWRMALAFGAFQALMPVVSIVIGQVVRDWLIQYHGWIALVVLVALGVNMIREDAQRKEETVDVSKLLVLAVATSIDSLASGLVLLPLSLGDLVEALMVIGAGSLLMSLLGSWLGEKVGAHCRRWHPKALGGVVLILIGIKLFIN